LGGTQQIAADRSADRYILASAVDVAVHLTGNVYRSSGHPQTTVYGLAGADVHAISGAEILGASRSPPQTQHRGQANRYYCRYS
jgi:hypothetical protein